MKADWISVILIGAVFGIASARGAARVDYYEILGISQTASPAEIKHAYRNLVMATHPDLHPGDVNLEKQFLAVKEAYETLSQPLKRSFYDLTYIHPQPQSGSVSPELKLRYQTAYEHFMSPIAQGGRGLSAEEAHLAAEKIALQQTLPKIKDWIKKEQVGISLALKRGLTEQQAVNWVNAYQDFNSDEFQNQIRCKLPALKRMVPKPSRK